MAATWQRSIEAFYGCGGVGKGRGARGLHQTLDSLAHSVCDRTVMQLPNQLIIMPYFNKETFISVLDGRKALRHQVFMYMDCKCQHFCDPSVILLLCFTSLVRLICSYFPPSGSKQNTLTCLSVGLFHVVMLYLLLYAVPMLLEWLVWSTKQKDWDSAMFQDFLNSIMTHR